MANQKTYQDQLDRDAMTHQYWDDLDQDWDVYEIFMPKDNYDTEFSEGQNLLAEEIVHIDQDNKRGGIRKDIDDPLIERLIKLSSKFVDPNEKVRKNAVEEVFNAGIPGWSILINSFDGFSYIDVEMLIIDKMKSSTAFRNYVESVVYLDPKGKSSNALKLLRDSEFISEKNIAYFKETIVAELVAIREHVREMLKGSHFINTKDIKLKKHAETFNTRINKLLNIINEGEIDLADLVELRNQINFYYKAESHLEKVISIANVFGYDENIPESNYYADSNATQDKLREHLNSFAISIFQDFFILSPTSYGSFLVDPREIGFNKTLNNSVLGVESAVIRGSILDIDHQLQFLEGKFKNLINAMEKDESEETVVQLSIVMKMYGKFTKLRKDFSRETKTIERSDNQRITKKFESWKEKFIADIADFSGMFMTASFTFTINSLLNLREDSWQWFDKSSSETLDHKEVLEDALFKLQEAVKEHSGDPSELIPIIQEIIKSEEYKEAFEYFQEYAKEEEEHRMWVGLALMIVMTFLSILGGIFLQSALPTLLSSLAVRTGVTTLSNLAVISIQTVPALMINSLGFVVTNKLLMHSLLGNGKWDTFVQDYIYTVLTFGALKVSGNIYRSIVNPSVGQAFYKGGMFAVELATLEGVSAALVAWENRGLPEEEKQKLWSWEGLAVNVVFLSMLKGMFLAISKKGIPFIDKMNQSTRENIMKMREDITFMSETMKRNSESSGMPVPHSEIESLGRESIKLMELEYKGVMEVYNESNYKRLPKLNETKLEKKNREKEDSVVGENLLMLAESIRSNINDMYRLIALEKLNITPANESGTINYFQGTPVELEKALNESGDRSKSVSLLPVNIGGSQRLYQFKQGERTVYFVLTSSPQQRGAYPGETAKQLGYSFKEDVLPAFWQQVIFNNGGTQGLDLNRISDLETNLIIQEALMNGWRPGDPIPNPIMNQLSSGRGNIYDISYLPNDPELQHIQKEKEIYLQEGVKKARNLGIIFPQENMGPAAYAKFVLGSDGWKQAFNAFWSDSATIGLESMKKNMETNLMIRDMLRNGWRPGKPIPETYRKQLVEIKRTLQNQDKKSNLDERSLDDVNKQSGEAGAKGSDIFKDFKPIDLKIKQPIEFGGDLMKRDGVDLYVLGRTKGAKITGGKGRYAGTMNIEDIEGVKLLKQGIPDHIAQKYPNSLADQTKAYWEEINRPWLDKAIESGADIRFIQDPRLPQNAIHKVTEHQRKSFPKLFKDMKEHKTYLHFEYQYLLKKGYKLNENGLMTKIK